ncbi:energy transducer TonB [Salinimicrobium soli]|uniref:energy transducer TonB n=1 Tax=Salinimicrobium soli TaxID=1254399 RepID=UPI003AAB3668
MKKLLFFYLLISSTYLFSQDTIFIDRHYKETLDKSTAIFYSIKERSAENADAGYNRLYWISGQIKKEEYFSSFKEEVLEGKKTLWKEDGSLWTESEYVKGKLHGYLISYWENGQLKRKDLYKKGKLKEKKVWDSTGKAITWYPMEVHPRFPGGKSGLENYIKANAKKPNGVAGGKVVVGFVIDIDGSITDVRIEETSSFALNLSAYNVVAKMPAWKPGERDGEIVRVKYSIPLVFR